jgi:hypothetical protein
VQIQVAPPPPATQLKLDKKRERLEAIAAKEQLAAQRRADREERLRAKEDAIEAKRASKKRARQVRARKHTLPACCERLVPVVCSSTSNMCLYLMNKQ